jgi:hypothetical protein
MKGFLKATVLAVLVCQCLAPAIAAAEECDAGEGRRGNAAGGVSVQTLWLNAKPIQDLTMRDRYLKGKSFDLTKRLTPMIGLTSYRESNAGLRTGLGAWVGYKLYQSETYRVTDNLGVHDSMTALRVIPVYGGFQLEKGFRFWHMDAHAGALLGGGAYVVHKTSIDVGNPSVFTDPDRDTASSSVAGDWAMAGFGTVELNAGMLFSVAPVLQIGLDGVLNVVYSPEGFGVGYGDFYSVNPGVRLRLLFGRA